MSGADFEAEVSNSMRRIQASAEALSKSQDKLEQGARRYGDEAARAFNRGAEAMGETSRHTERLGRELGHLSKGPEALGKGLIELGSRFGIWGGAAVAVVGGVSAAVGKLSDKIKEASGTLAGLGKHEADSKLELGAANLGPNVDIGEVVSAAQSATGPVKQEQINAFVRKLADSGLKLNTQQVTSAIREYAEVAPVAGEGDALIESLRTTGYSTSGTARLRGKLDQLGRAAPGELAFATSQRANEVDSLEVGGALGLQEAGRALITDRKELRDRNARVRDGFWSRTGLDTVIDSAEEEAGHIPILGGVPRAVRQGHERTAQDADPLLRELKAQTTIMQGEANKPTPRAVGEGH